MSLVEVKGPIELGTPEYVPLASHTMVLRTRREVRVELERSKASRSLLRRTLLPSSLCMGIGLLIIFHPGYELAVLYFWALMVLIPWLIVRKEKKRIGRQLL